MSTSRVHIVKGPWVGRRTLANVSVTNISPFLTAGEAWSPKRLRANAKRAFQGSVVLGMGFTLSEEEVDAIRKDDPTSREVLFPYVNGEDLTTDPEQLASRWIINFWDWSQERAATYGTLFAIVREKVKPERDRQKRSIYKNKWWQFAEKCPGLYHAIGRGAPFESHPTGEAGYLKPLARVIAVAQTSKYLTVCWQPSDRVYSNALIVIASDSDALFASLNSTFHLAWVATHSSTLESRLRYVPTDCFETFPFPPETDLLAEAGRTFSAMRSEAMKSMQLGLTALYNMLGNAAINDAPIVGLREAIRTLDHAAAAAYGWDDLQLDHDVREIGWLPGPPRSCFAVSESCRASIFQRLTALNRLRYDEEVCNGLHDGVATHVPRTRRAEAITAPQSSLDLRAPSENLATYLIAAERHGRYAADPGSAIVEFLKSHTDWHAKATIIAAIGITDNQWNAAITNLVTNGLVERQGERRGARYRSQPERNGANGARS